MARTRFSPSSGLHHLLSDAIDTATEALYKAASKYDSTRGPFSHWANAFISKRLHWLSLRGNSPQLELQDVADDSLPHSHSNSHDSDLPPHLLYSLTSGQRIVVKEKIQSQRTFNEIGLSLGVTRQAAHRRYKRALRRIRRDLQQPSLFA